MSLGILSTPLPLSRDDNDEDDVADDLHFDSDDAEEEDTKTPSVDQLAKSVKLCGYYAAKAAVPGAEVVVTSYQNLFGGGSYFSDELHGAEGDDGQNGSGGDKSDSSKTP